MMSGITELAADATPLIRVRGLGTRFGDVVVHEQLDLDVFDTEILSLVGGSGSGKTSLLRVLLGLQEPAAGSLQIFGDELGKGADAGKGDEALQRLRRRSGMLFQHGALFSGMSAFDNVAQPLCELRSLPAALIRDATLQKLDMVGITPAQSLRMPADLSGGMVKRVALARALALEPALLFLDEPTAGLDPALSESFVELIRSLHRALHLTVVMVTHDLDTLLALSTRIAVLANKRVITTGGIDEVIAVDHPFIREFFLGARGLRALQAGTHDTAPPNAARKMRSD